MTKSKLVICMSLVVCFAEIIAFSNAKEISGDDMMQAMMYMQKFGYMSKTDDLSSVTEKDMHEAIIDFQEFFGIEATGSLNDKTMEMMNTPRCGVPDKVKEVVSVGRGKRFALEGSVWNETNLTYKISKYSNKLRGENVVDEEIARAFKVWSDVTPLNFIAKTSGPVHIDIRFEFGEHGDGDAFDGPSQTLAHAFFPRYGGNAHFDDDENWTANSNKGINLFLVAVHEIGHSLGLLHSNVRTAVMMPTIQRYDPNFKLDPDDIKAITALYGRRKKTDDEPKEENPGISGRRGRPRTNSGDAPNLCQSPEIDAITKTADGKTYAFKGKYYWRIIREEIANGYPKLIQKDWENLPNDIDAALTWSNGKTFFFKGEKYWRYSNMKADPGYPREIRVFFKTTPPNFDVVLEWTVNENNSKGSKKWQFQSQSDSQFDKKKYNAFNILKIKNTSNKLRTKVIEQYSVKCPTRSQDQEKPKIAYRYTWEL